MKFKDWSDHYFESDIRMTAKKHTYYTYQILFVEYVLPYFGEMELEKIERKDVQDFICKISGKNLSASSVHLIYKAFRHCISLALDEEAIIVDPCRKIHLPTRKAVPVEVFTASEQHRIEKAVYAEAKKDHRLYGIILSLYTGMRLGELLALRWEDVDMRDNKIHINQTVYAVSTKSEGFKIIIDSPKTESSKRIIPFADNIKGILKILKEDKSDYVLSKHGLMLMPRTYEYLYHNFLKRNNIPTLKFHSLRHTFATRSLELGIDIKTLSELMGHESADITLKTYSHTLMETKVKAARKLSTLSVNYQKETAA